MKCRRTWCGAVMAAACAASASAQELAWIPQYVPGPDGAYQSVGVAYDSARRVVVFFGSSGAGGRTWEWDGEGWRDRGPGGPQTASRVSMAYDAARGVSVLQSTQGTWEWDGGEWRHERRNPFDYLEGASLVYDPVRAESVLHGGASGSRRDSTTRAWHGEEWVDRAAHPALGRAYHAAAFDSARGLMILFGGDASAYLCGDTWEWDGVSWTLRAIVGPSPRVDVVMCYDEVLGLCVLHGGRDGYPLWNDTWAWDGTAWRELVIPGPPALHNRALAYDAARGVSLLVGRTGSSTDDRWQTWMLRTPCDFVSPASQPQAVHAAPGDDAALTVVAGGTPLSFQWRRDGVALADGPRVTGSGTPTLSISGLRSADIGLYDCVVRGECNSLYTEPASVDCRPLILSQPEGGRLDDPMTLSVVVAPGAGTLYQWMRSGQPLSDIPGVIEGSGTSSLSLLISNAEYSGEYQVLVTNDCGEVRSEAVTVQGPCFPPDYNGDGSLDQDDLEAWFNCLGDSAMCPLDVDFNQDGNIDQDDWVWIVHYIAGGGCP
ncbi:MAG: immunoglobulin domain-containing protein [Phycisphaerales bacterium]